MSLQFTNKLYFVIHITNEVNMKKRCSIRRDLLDEVVSLVIAVILPSLRCSRGLRGADTGLGKAIGVPCCVSVRPSMFGLGIMTAERRKGRRIPISEAGLGLIFEKP